MMYPLEYGAVGAVQGMKDPILVVQKFAMNTMTPCERELSLSSTPHTHPQEGREHNVCQDMLNEEQLILAANQAFSVTCRLDQY